MTATSVSLYVTGSRVQVVDTLGFLTVHLPDDSEVWVDRDVPPIVDDEESELGVVEGWVYVDVVGVSDRAEAIATVARAADHADPERDVITGGDIYKIRLLRADHRDDDDWGLS